jgi:hypothetical protein
MSEGSIVAIRVPYASWYRSGYKGIEGRIEITPDYFIFKRNVHPALKPLGKFVKAWSEEELCCIKLSDIVDCVDAMIGKERRLELTVNGGRRYLFGTIKIETIIKYIQQRQQ